MVYDADGNFIDNDSKQLLDEIGCFLRQQLLGQGRQP